MPVLHQFLACSIVFCLLAAELTPLSAAGLIVPGYVAYYLYQPWLLFILFAAAALTFVTEKALSSITLLFGRRLLATDVLLSFFYVQLLVYFSSAYESFNPLNLDAIAYFIPALIVIFIGANGLKKTLFSILILTLIIKVFAELIILLF